MCVLMPALLYTLQNKWWKLFGLFQAFDVVEKSYFKTIDDALAEKARLSNFVLPHNEVNTFT